jgi:hypothetical protein
MATKWGKTIVDLMVVMVIEWDLMGFSGI